MNRGTESHSQGDFVEGSVAPVGGVREGPKHHSGLLAAIAAILLLSVTGCDNPASTNSPPHSTHSDGSESGGSLTPTDPSHPSSCSGYKDNLELLGYCLTAVARHRSAQLPPNEICSSAGTWEAACRDAWVSARIDSADEWSREELLGNCVTDDCRLQVVDHRRAPSITGQLDLCVEYTGEFSDDCFHHALAEWLRGEPSIGEIDAVSRVRHNSSTVGLYVAAAVHCLDLGECRGAPQTLWHCRKDIGGIAADPETCEVMLAPKVSISPEESSGFGLSGLRWW